MMGFYHLIRGISRNTYIILTGIILCFCVPSHMYGGSYLGIVPDLTYPYEYRGDALSLSWAIQRIREGWFYSNERAGYPFGSYFYDFPTSDAGSYVVFKLLSMLVNGFAPVYDLYFLLGFPLTFTTTYFFLRWMKVPALLSLSGGIVYAFIPFHFQRLGHLLYTWYFVVPIYFYWAIQCAYDSKKEKNFYCRPSIGGLLNFSGAIVLSSFGLYYALFGAITIIIGGLYGALYCRDLRPIKSCSSFISAIFLGIIINLSPNIIYQKINGANSEAVQRDAPQSEIHALKLVQLLMPRPSHPIEKLAEFRKNYDQSTPLVNENGTANLGVITSVGFLLLLFGLLVNRNSFGFNARIEVLVRINIFLFLLATVGGFSSVIAVGITPLIRSWNRISIFIGLGSLSALLIITAELLNRINHHIVRLSAAIAVAILLIIISYYDQAKDICKFCDQNRVAFNLDRDFISNIESALPSGSAIYNLPYISFPEGASVVELQSPDPAIGFLHSKKLKWSWGNTKGRKPDLFYRSLANAPVSEQINVIKQMGFLGIYVDRRGYEDKANTLIGELTNALGQGPNLERLDGSAVFFKINNTQSSNVAEKISD